MDANGRHRASVCGFPYGPELGVKKPAWILLRPMTYERGKFCCANGYKGAREVH